MVDSTKVKKHQVFTNRPGGGIQPLAAGRIKRARCESLALPHLRRTPKHIPGQVQVNRSGSTCPRSVRVPLHIFLNLGCFGPVFASETANLGPISAIFGQIPTEMASNRAFRASNDEFGALINCGLIVEHMC